MEGKKSSLEEPSMKAPSTFLLKPKSIFFGTLAGHMCMDYPDL